VVRVEEDTKGKIREEMVERETASYWRLRGNGGNAETGQEHLQRDDVAPLALGGRDDWDWETTPTRC